MPRGRGGRRSDLSEVLPAELSSLLSARLLSRIQESWLPQLGMDLHAGLKGALDPPTQHPPNGHLQTYR